MEDQLRAKMVSALAEYHAMASNDTVSQKQLRDKSEEIASLRKQLSDLLAAEAVECPKCHSKPSAHLKTLIPANEKANAYLKTLVPANEKAQTQEKRTYEVFCVGCLLRSRGDSIRAATVLWNAGEYVQ